MRIGLPSLWDGVVRSKKGKSAKCWAQAWLCKPCTKLAARTWPFHQCWCCSCSQCDGASWVVSEMCWNPVPDKHPLDPGQRHLLYKTGSISHSPAHPSPTTTLPFPWSPAHHHASFLPRETLGCVRGRERWGCGQAAHVHPLLPFSCWCPPSPWLDVCFQVFKF